MTDRATLAALADAGYLSTKDYVRELAEMVPPDNAPASDEVVVTQADRDAAAIVLRGMGYPLRATETGMGVYSDDGPLTQAFARHRLAASTASVPAGMVLVPVKPTEAMLTQGWGETPGDWMGDRGELADVWSAMLAASPPPPATTDVKWGNADTVGNLIAQLQTFDPAAPIFAGYHVTMNDGSMRSKVRGLHLSRERVVGSNIVRDDVPLTYVAWAGEPATTDAAEGLAEAFAAWMKRYVGEQNPDIMRFSLAEMMIAFDQGASYRSDVK